MMRIIKMAISLSLGLLAFGCQLSNPDGGSGDGSGGEGTEAKAVAPGRTVLLVTRPTSEDFNREVVKGARRAAKDLGLGLIVKSCDSRKSAEREQSAAINEAVENKYGALVISAASSDNGKLVETLAKAHKAGVKIVNVDNQFDPVLLLNHDLRQVPYIGVDNEKGAGQVVKHLCQGIDKDTDAVIIQGDAGDLVAQERRKGALNAFKEIEKVKVVARGKGYWNSKDANRVMKKLYLIYPHIKIVFCENDDMAIGAADYLRKKRKRRIQVSGFDNIPEIRSYIKKGLVSATVDARGDAQGYLAVKFANDLIDGQTVPLRIVQEPKLVTKKTMQ